jgi:uncharacterized protein YehS (DUF1456 family)
MQIIREFNFKIILPELEYLIRSSRHKNNYCIVINQGNEYTRNFMWHNYLSWRLSSYNPNKGYCIECIL